MITALYIHIPFCNRKCHYCSFCSYSGMESLYDRYVACLIKEIKSYSEQFTSEIKLSSIFIGGGTPTILSPEHLDKILSNCDECFTLDEDAEISIEANPGTIGKNDLILLKKSGFNRLSLGIQSFIDRELMNLGRCHNSFQAKEVVDFAFSAGFENISLDLMYGVPDQQLEDWCYNLDTALKLNPNHLSLYQLTFEEGTKLNDLVIKGEVIPVEEDTILKMDAYNKERTLKSSMKMYEVSNFARPGFECRHNINYWLNNEYLGAGTAAVSYVNGTRERRLENPVDYCIAMEGGNDIIVERERLDNEAAFRETVIMGLRMCDGISPSQLEDRFGIDLISYYGTNLEKFIKGDFIEMTPDKLFVTEKGRMVLNSILAELV